MKQVGPDIYKRDDGVFVDQNGTPMPGEKGSFHRKPRHSQDWREKITRCEACKQPTRHKPIDTPDGEIYLCKGCSDELDSITTENNEVFAE